MFANHGNSEVIVTYSVDDRRQPRDDGRAKVSDDGDYSQETASVHFVVTVLAYTYSIFDSKIFDKTTFRFDLALNIFKMHYSHMPTNLTG